MSGRDKFRPFLLSFYLLLAEANQLAEPVIGKGNFCIFFNYYGGILEFSKIARYFFSEHVMLKELHLSFLQEGGSSLVAWMLFFRLRMGNRIF